MHRITFILALLTGLALADDPALNYDLNAITPASGDYTRIHGYTGTGAGGVPVCGGFDINGDGFADSAFAQFQSSTTQDIPQTGEVTLVLGNGGFGEIIDTSIDTNRVLRIFGGQFREMAGSEIWLDDVTGDGLGDLMICRQHFDPATNRAGAGALSILIGGPDVTTLAEADVPLLLENPTNIATLVHIHGVAQFDRFGIWIRTGDVNGDGIADLIVGADQEDPVHATGSDNGGIWVIQGGPHLATGQVIDLADFGTPAQAHPGRIAHILPPASSSSYHLGGTCAVGDLDGNGKAEVLAAATINRAGAGLNAPGSVSTAGAPQGKMYVIWDDNFIMTNGIWAAGLSWIIDHAAAPGNSTTIQGSANAIIEGEQVANKSFGEELAAGLDFNGDGNADLFAGDLVARINGQGNSGSGHVFYNITDFRTAPDIDLDSPPTNLVFSVILGPRIGSLGGDTIALGDFDADGQGDLLFGNPHDHPVGRGNAGSMHILYGQNGNWPRIIDLKEPNLPGPDVMRITRIPGAIAGDVLCYSAASGDMNGDGRTDVIANEMTGDGLNGAQNVGNFLLIDGAALLQPQPVLTGIACTGPALQDVMLEFDTVPGASYRVQRSDSLISTNWIDVVTDIPGNGSTTNAVDPGAVSTRPRAVYRVGAE